MEQMIEYNKTYEEYKKEFDGVLQKAAEGFVRIGYLLKVARDTNVLAESGYKTVAEFAEAEYSLDKTQVSRFISINDKFSENGYSDHLIPTYSGFGYAKLTLMLQIPDSINEELTPDYTKAEIQTIKEEVAEEQKVSDIERMLEKPKTENESVLYKVLLQLGEDEPELFIEIAKSENLEETMAPAGEKMFSVRVMGTGRMMLFISEASDKVKVINSRSGEKESFSWDEVKETWADIIGEGEPEDCWERRYERKFPKVAPVQQKEEQKPKKPEKKPEKKTEKKEKKVVKAKTDWMSAYKVGQKIKVIANGRIGTLFKKTETSGLWKVDFETHGLLPDLQTEMTEQQFEAYVEIQPEEEIEKGQEEIEKNPEKEIEKEPEEKEIEKETKEEEYDLEHCTRLEYFGRMSTEDAAKYIHNNLKLTDLETEERLKEWLSEKVSSWTGEKE